MIEMKKFVEHGFIYMKQNKLGQNLNQQLLLPGVILKRVYYWYENEEGLEWVSVITISGAISLGDHNVYATLGSISLVG